MLIYILKSIFKRWSWSDIGVRTVFCFVLFCFVLLHINLIGHLMPNKINENKSEKKFKREVLGINDKVYLIGWLLFLFFVVLLGIYLKGIMIIKKQKMWNRLEKGSVC